MKSRSFYQAWISVPYIALFAVPVFAQQPAPHPAPTPAPPPQVAPVPPRPPAPIAPAADRPVPAVPGTPAVLAPPHAPRPGPAAAVPALPGSPSPLPEEIRPVEDEQPTMVRVYALKYAKADEVAKTISRAAPGRPPIQAVPDHRTNAVILTATADRFKIVDELIRQLDVAASDSVSDRIVQVLVLRNARAEEIVRMLQAVAPDATFAADPSSNKLVFSGSAAAKALVQELVQRLDQEKPGAEPPQGRKVRVIWLVSGLELPPPPPDMKDVVEELASMGVEGLGLAAQSIVQTVSSGKFSVQCSPAAFGNCRLRIEGMLQEQNNESPRVELMLSAMGTLHAQPSTGPQPVAPPAVPQPMPAPPVPQSSQLASISTTLMAPPGHKVVLGVSPIEKHTSVFVIHVLPGTSGR